MPIKDRAASESVMDGRGRLRLHPKTSQKLGESLAVSIGRTNVDPRDSGIGRSDDVVRRTSSPNYCGVALEWLKRAAIEDKD